LSFFFEAFALGYFGLQVVLKRLHKLLELVNSELLFVGNFGNFLINIFDLLDQLSSFGHDSLLLSFDALKIRFIFLEEFLLRSWDSSLKVKSGFDLFLPVGRVLEKRLPFLLWFFLFGFLIVFVVFVSFLDSLFLMSCHLYSL
jgi:hypothetical protein